MAMLKGLKLKTVFKILFDIEDLALISTERQLRVEVIRRGSLQI